MRAVPPRLRLMQRCQNVTTYLALLVLMAACGCGRPAQDTLARPKDLALQSDDGLRLAATLYTARGPNPPGLVLVHMLGSDRHGWHTFALRAQRDGYTCLAIDLRGHGDSAAQNSGRLTYRNFNRDDWLATLKDIDAAKRALVDSGADPDDLGVAGASIGANLALHYALKHSDIQCVILISPGIDYKGIGTETELVAYGNRPVLLLTAQGDAYSAASCTTLKKNAPGLCELREYPGTAHGTDLFAASTNAAEQILLWLKPIIGLER